MPSFRAGPNADLEKPPQGEAAQIAETTELIEELLNKRYKDKSPFLRGVHPKDHGCVEATFTVLETLAPEYRVGVFGKPGERFRAAIRFSNAAPLVLPDCLPEMGKDGKPIMRPDGKPLRTHGSRGMAIKLYNVGGARLTPDDKERTQDFLMINQPFFAFANAQDYRDLNKVILRDNEAPNKFFEERFANAAKDPVAAGRAKTTFGIFQSIKLGSATPPFQAPPLSPLDNSYFGAAPFLFGEGRAMRFAARPVNPKTGDVGTAVDDPNYLRNAMLKRLADAGGKDICFDFQIQVRSADKIKPEEDIEDACRAWDETTDKFITVARIAIPPQDITTPERKEFCEKLFYTPWHGLADHRPLGGINRLRQDVYDRSAKLRGCPVSPDLPSPGRRNHGLEARAEALRQAGRSPGGGPRGQTE
jgi:hypothetical protein